SRELLTETGSCLVQISDENLQYIRNLMDEIFGPANLMSLISFRTKIPLNAAFLPNIADYLVWYAKDKAKVKFRRLFVPREIGAHSQFTYVEENNSATRSMTREELENPRLLPAGSRP